MTTDKSSEREAFVYWWRHKYSAADLEGISEHVALNAAWAAWQARAALPQQAQDIAEASGGAEGGPEEDRIEAAFWRFDARHKGYGEWRQAPMSERDAFKAEMRNALHAEAVRAEMRMVAKGWRKPGPQQAQETSLPLTEEQIGKHTLLAGDCPPASEVLLVSSVRRLQAKTVAQTSLPPQGAADVRLADDDALRFACRVLEGNYPTEQDKRDARSGLMAIRTRLREPTAASPAPAPQEPARPIAWMAMAFGVPAQATTDEPTAIRWRKAGGDVRPLYASPAPGELGAASAGWISVADRLPEPDSGEVLVWLSGGRCAFDEWHMHREDPTGMSTTHTMEMGLMWRDYEFEDITHWMPLPQPPQQAPSESSAQGSGGEKV